MVSPLLYGTQITGPAAPQPWWAGVNSALGKNSNLLLGLGAGLLSGNLAEVPQAIAQGSQADTAYAASKKADAERLQGINQTAAWLKQNYPQYASLPPSEGFQLALKDMSAAPVDPTSTYQGRLTAGQQQGLTGVDLTTYALTGKLPGGNQTARAGVGQPVYFQSIKDPNVIRAVQPMTTGAGQDMLTGGTLPGDPSDWRVVDPATMAGTKATTAADAKNAAAARAALPGAQQAFDIANKAADALLNDSSGMAEQFGNTLGFPNQWMPVAAPGSNMARFRAELEQGGGQAFMQARQMLKGGGQITDFEGAKAEAAFSRMQLAAQNNNQEEFMQAVRDFQDAVNSGYEKLKAAANGDYAAGSPAVTGAGNVTSSGVKWSVTP